ncbi:MAG: CstA-like transporter-associated (seleno)protein [Gammaproteobacteria bacterium]
MKTILDMWREVWRAWRALTGDDAYERYLAHCWRRHPDAIPLDRGSYYASEQERRWSQPNRCC